MDVWFWVILVVVIAGAVGLVLFWRRRRYLGQVRELGWSHDSRPTMDAIADLQAPPFALGLSRSVDELICGTTTGGFRFRVFEYDYSGSGPKYRDRLAVLELPFALPDAFVFAGAAGDRMGIALGDRQLVQAEGQGLRVISTDAGLSTDLIATIGPAAALLGASGSVDLGVDTNHLVVANAPKKVDQLAAFLVAADQVAAALSSSAALSARRISPPPVTPFYGHPDWSWIDVDDQVLGIYPTDSGGYGHRTESLVRGLRDGIRMDAFVHHWKTDETVTETDSDGNTHTRTETRNHAEAICGFVLPFAMPAISLNGRRVGEKVRFESTDFNKAFKVRTQDAKFASDVTHPRMMEWLLSMRPYGWTVEGQVVSFEVDRHDLLIVDACETTLRGWLGRFPRFVWQNLRQAEPPFLVE